VIKHQKKNPDKQTTIAFKKKEEAKTATPRPPQ
jgi:hypothetical protein